MNLALDKEGELASCSALRVCMSDSRGGKLVTGLISLSLIFICLKISFGSLQSKARRGELREIAGKLVF
jgi:hypothetical protein